MPTFHAALPLLRTLQRVTLASFACIATFVLMGCAAIDPQHLLTRDMGNHAPANGAALDASTRKEAFDFVWTRIHSDYVDPHFNGVDWVQAGRTHQEPILAAPDDAAFWKRLDTMVAELGDAHTRVLSPRQYALHKEKRNFGLGLSVAELGGEIVVTAVAKASPAAAAGIQTGNKVLAVDGVDALPWWTLQMGKARKNSTERARLVTVKRTLDGGDLESPADTVTLRLERNDATVFTTLLTRQNLPRKDTLTGQLLPGSVGYIRITGFDPTLGRDLPAAMAAVKDAKGLVIDLRGNRGGSFDLTVAVMNQLVQGKVSLGKRITRTGKPPALLWGLWTLGDMQIELKGAEKPFLGPIVVLVDGNSASGSELLAGGLQSIGRAKVVGETTCGCLLGYLGYANIPGGGGLAYSELDFALVRGPRIEAYGVQPDHRVIPTREDLIAGKDRALERAVALLTSPQE